MDRKDFELLMPVGGRDQLFAAVENGCDAVYFGLNGFNARMKADNFTLDDLPFVLDYCHLKGVYCYLTLNTLADDKSVAGSVELGVKAWDMGVDAIIVQDLGVAYELQRRRPKINLHLSTQGSVYNIEGVRQAKKLGFSRVVLARELPYQDIEEISGANLLELEVFVHGALCFSYSGQCHMSRNMGGRSANCGVCAQPCRLLYEHKKAAGQSSQKGTDQNLTKYERILSPKELSLVEHLPMLMKLGVKSFKVEGRMRSPGYVATVARIFNEQITKICKQKTDSHTDCIKDLVGIDAQRKKELTQVYSREGFTAGRMLSSQNKGKLAGTRRANDINTLTNGEMSGGTGKHSGIYAGDVVNIVKGKRGFVVKAQLFEDAENGDLIELRDEKNSIATFTLTYLKKDGCYHWLGDVMSLERQITPKDKLTLQRLVSKKLTEKSIESFSKLGEYEIPNKRKSEVEMNLQYVDGQVILSATTSVLGEKISCVAKTTAENNNTLDKARHGKLLAGIKKTGNTVFEVSKAFVSEEVPMMPVALVNSLRREVLEKLEAAILQKWMHAREDQGSGVMAYTREISDSIKTNHLNKNEKHFTRQEGERCKFIYFYEIEDFLSFLSRTEASKCRGKNSCTDYKTYALLPLVELIQIFKLEKAHEIKLTLDNARDVFNGYIPYIGHISRGNEDKILREEINNGGDNIKKVTEAICKNDIKMMVDNIGHFNFASKIALILDDEAAGESQYNKLEIIGGPHLNCINAACRKVYEKMGVTMVLPQMEKLTKDNGCIPLMTTEYTLNVDAFKDRKNVEYKVVSRCYSDAKIITWKHCHGERGIYKPKLYNSNEVNIFFYSR